MTTELLLKLTECQALFREAEMCRQYDDGENGGDDAFHQRYNKGRELFDECLEMARAECKIGAAG